MLEEPVNTKWTDEETEISKGEYEYQNVIVQEVKNRVKGQKWEFYKKGNDVVYIKPEDISTEVINKKPVTKMIYDEWNKFFVQLSNDSEGIQKFGKLKCSNKKEFLNALGLEDIEKKTACTIINETKPEVVNNIYYFNETEWDINQERINLLQQDSFGYEDEISDEQNAYEIDKLTKTNYYFNPLTFIHHLDKVAGNDEFNPFIKYNKKADYGMKDNPGFMPERDFSFTQKFNNPSTSTYSHEGVDLAVDRGNCGQIGIISGINGKVIVEGDKGNYSYGCFLVIQAREQHNGKYRYYLLGHLDRNSNHKKEGDPVYPDDIVGYVGNTGHCSTGQLDKKYWSAEDIKKGYADFKGSNHAEFRTDGYGAHLHLQMFLRDDESKDFVTNMDLQKLKNAKGENDRIQCADTGIVNPFDYSETYEKDTKK